MTATTKEAELRSEAAIYCEGTGYKTDDLVRAYREYVTDCHEMGSEPDDCQRYFEQYTKE
jgi:hypothetical protein